MSLTSYQIYHHGSLDFSELNILRTATPTELENIRIAPIIVSKGGMSLKNRTCEIIEHENVLPDHIIFIGLNWSSFYQLCIGFGIKSVSNNKEI